MGLAFFRQRREEAAKKAKAGADAPETDPVKALTSTSVKELEAALAGTDDVAVIRAASEADKRTTAGPKYEARLAELAPTGEDGGAGDGGEGGDGETDPALALTETNLDELEAALAEVDDVETVQAAANLDERKGAAEMYTTRIDELSEPDEEDEG